jgi:UDP-3-O-[3-hydroxymyristoyl] N-acetylglucosamine deacetylase
LRARRFVDTLRRMDFPHNQHTLSRVASCSSVGLHTGAEVAMRLLPAAPGTGIVFRRTDIDGGASDRAVIPARYDRVTDTMLGTTVENEHGVAVATVEHLMAALWGMGVDNAVVEVRGPELPIMDGSSADFARMIADAGVVTQPAPRTVLVMDAPLHLSEGESRASLLPHAGFTLEVEIAFDHPAIAHQRGFYDFSRESFRDALGSARTFGFASDVEKLRAAGLARGGSLANAVVIGEEGVLNAEGLRCPDEFVRHKALDCVGDYFLSGYRIFGKAVTLRPGHALNNRLLRALFNTPSAWHLATVEEAEAEAKMHDQAMHGGHRSARSDGAFQAAAYAPERQKRL